MPPAAGPRWKGSAGLLKKALTGTSELRPLARLAGAVGGVWMCGWREEVSLAEGPFMSHGRGGPSWAREDFGGSSVADSKRRCLREQLGAWCFPRRKFGTLLCLQVSGCTGLLVVTNRFIHTITLNILCWRCHTCAECAQSLLVLAVLGPHLTQARLPLLGQHSAWGSILSVYYMSGFSKPSPLVLLALHRASPRFCICLSSTSAPSGFAGCTLLHRDAHRSECLHPLLADRTVTPSASPFGQPEFKLNFPNFL